MTSRFRTSIANARVRLDKVRSSYWFLPSVMAVGAVLLSLTAIYFDTVLSSDAVEGRSWIFTGGPDGARGVLSAIATTMITVAGVTFSITIVTLTLASQQFGPRLIRSFMRDRGNQFVLGVFTSVYLYALLVLRTVRGGDDSENVPQVSITIAILLAVLAVGVLIYFVHHVAESIQASYLLKVVAADLKAAIHEVYPEKEEKTVDLPERGAVRVLESKNAGYLQAVDTSALVSTSHEAEATVFLCVRPGEFIFTGAPLLEFLCESGDIDEEELRSAFLLGQQRTTVQDAEFAFQQFVEVALRALSPSLNDPFTAMGCIDRIADGLLLVDSRHLPRRAHCNGEGRVCVVSLPASYQELIEPVFGQLREGARDSKSVLEHLRFRLEYLIARVATPDLRESLRAELLAFGPEQQPTLR